MISSVQTCLGRPKRVLLCDNYGAHSNQKELAASLNTDLRTSPPNSTDKLQPCDSFVIKNIKSTWADKWLAYKNEAIDRHDCSSSGQVHNPGKHWYIKTMADVLREANTQKFKHGYSAAQKATTECGLSTPPDNGASTMGT